MPSICSELSAICWSRKRAKDEKTSTWLIGPTHVAILDQDGYGAHDCLQWRAHIGGLLGDFHSHPDRSARRLPIGVFPLVSGTIARCVAEIVEGGADGWSDGRRCRTKRLRIPRRRELSCGPRRSWRTWRRRIGRWLRATGDTEHGDGC